MGDGAVVTDRSQLPLTGVGEELDALLSARFVNPFQLMVRLGGAGRPRKQRACGEELDGLPAK